MPFGDHTLLLSQDGGLLAFGRNREGQLGLGHQKVQSEPAEVPWNGPQPVQVDWGRKHSLVLDAEGGVWDAGCSRSSAPFLTFQKVPELPCIALVAAGYSHSAAIDTEGGLWVWTSKIDLCWARRLPQRVGDLPVIFKVACGLDFLVAEAEEGLWVLGRQLSLGHINNTLIPTLVLVEECPKGPLRCLAALAKGVILIDSQGGVFSAGDNSRGQLGRSPGDDYDSRLQRIGNIPPMLVASCGLNHTLSLDENGDVWAWGDGRSGRLGIQFISHMSNPTLVPSLKGTRALVLGRGHSLAFTEEGGLLVFGDNAHAQLGHSTRPLSLPTLSPIQPALPHSARSRKKSARSLASS